MKHCLQLWQQKADFGIYNVILGGTGNKMDSVQGDQLYPPSMNKKTKPQIREATDSMVE